MMDSLDSATVQQLAHTQANDQDRAAVVDQANALGHYHKTLLEHGLPRALCAQLTLGFQAYLFDSVLGVDE